MNFCLLRLSGIEWEDIQWFGMEIICKVLAWNLLGDYEENASTWHLGYLIFRQIWALCIHRPQTWHLVLRFGLHEATVAFTHQSSVYVSVVCVLCLCFWDITKCSKLSMYWNVSNVITLMSVNTTSPDSNVIYIFSLVPLRFFQYCVKLFFIIPWSRKRGGHSVSYRLSQFNSTPNNVVFL